MSGVSLHEVPLPPPEKPERERERRPEYEQAAVTVGAASAWVADLHRSARDFARRRGGTVALTIELDDGRRVGVRDLRAGPGGGFVTIASADDDERELGVRLDRIVGLELSARGDAFRVREGEVGFDAGT